MEITGADPYQLQARAVGEPFDDERGKKKPCSVELQADEGMLCVRWSDGTQSRYDLDGLRRSCPCALCREAREQSDELSLLSGDAISATAEAQRVDFVGLRPAYSMGDG